MKTKPDRGPGRPSGDHVVRQREIADTLLRVIGDSGFDKASMRVVAREAHCTTGVLTHYFSSKDDLIYHAIDLLFDWAERRAMIAARDGDSLKALQIALGVANDRERPSFDFWGVWLQVLVKAKQNDRLAKVVAKRHGRFRDLLTRIVEEGQKRKQIRADIDAELLADHINAVSDGLGLMAPLETKRLNSERSANLLKISIAFMRAK